MNARWPADKGGRVMNFSQIIIVLLLAFLLFTPQGRDIAELAMGSAMDAARTHAPAKTAQEVAACEKAYYAIHPHGYYDHAPSCY
jgi:hypothetical protein